MSYSRRQLYALGEPLGECVTIPKLGGGYVCGGGGDGGGKGGGKGGALGVVGAVASIGLAVATDGASLAAEGAIDGAAAATETAIASETFASAADVVSSSADAAISAGTDAATGTAAANSVVTTGTDAAASSIIPTDIPSVVTPPPEVAPYLDTTTTIPDVVPQTPAGGLPAADVVPTPDVAPLTPPAPVPDVAPPTGGLPSVDAATAQSVADAEDAAIGQSFQNAGFSAPQPGVLQSLADAGVPVPVLQNLPTIQSMTQLAAANAASQLLATGKIDVGSLTTSILAGSAGNLVGGLAAGQVYSDTQSALAASIASSVAKGATTAFISGQDPVQSGIASGIAGGIGSFTDGAVPQPFINAVVNSTFTKTPLDQALVGAAAQIGVGAAKNAVFGTQAPAPVDTGVPSTPDQSTASQPSGALPIQVAAADTGSTTDTQNTDAFKLATDYYNKILDGVEANTGTITKQDADAARQQAAAEYGVDPNQLNDWMEQTGPTGIYGTSYQNISSPATAPETPAIVTEGVTPSGLPTATPQTPVAQLPVQFGGSSAFGGGGFGLLGQPFFPWMVSGPITPQIASLFGQPVTPQILNLIQNPYAPFYGVAPSTDVATSQPSGALPSGADVTGQPSTTDQSAGALPATKLPEVTVTAPPEPPVVDDANAAPAPAPASTTPAVVTNTIPVSGLPVAQSAAAPTGAAPTGVASGTSKPSDILTYIPPIPGYLRPTELSTGAVSQASPLWAGIDPRLAQILTQRAAHGGQIHPRLMKILHERGGELVPGPENRLYMRHAKRGFAVEGPGTGQSDDIPTMLADGEYVFDADTVAALGDGSSKAGAEALDKMREAIRAHKRSAPVDKIPPKAKSPLEYLKMAKRK